MSDYKIKFTTEADTTGAKATAAEIKKVNAAVGDTRKPMEEAADATGKAEGITGKHIKGLKQLKDVIPGLSTALYTLTNAYAAAGAAVSALIGWLVSLKNKWDDLADADATSAAAMSAFEGRINRQKDKVKEMVDMLGEYKKAIDAANASQLGMDVELKDANDAIDEQLKLDVKRIENEKKIALAQLNANKGDLPEERFVRQQGKIEAEFDAQIHGVQQAARAGKQGNMAAFHVRARGKEKDQADAAAQFAADTAAADARLKDFDRGEEGQAELRKEADEAAKKQEKQARMDIAEYSQPKGAVGFLFDVHTQEKLRTDAEAKLREAQRDRRKIADDRETARRTREGLVDDVSASKDLYQQATRQGVGFRNTANTTQRSAIGLGQESNRAEASFRDDKATAAALNEIMSEDVLRAARAAADRLFNFVGSIDERTKQMERNAR